MRGSLRARVSWLLLLLVAISVISTPLTQNLWSWDRFLHGGQDFETGAFLILISLCLVIVLAGACKLCFERMLGALRAFAFVGAPVHGAAASITGLPAFARTNGVPAGALYNFPLQI